MLKTPAVRGLLAGFVLLVGSVSQTFAQSPNPGQMLNDKLAPKSEDVAITVPAPEDLKNLTVELVKGSTPGSSGWLLVDSGKKLPDGRPQPLRRFFDSNGDGKVDVWSYYKDGVEVYREFDTTYKAGRPNNFRWLNGGGTKWGVGGVDPATGKANIEFWRMISSEEVGYEAFHAVANGDYARLKKLFITEAEVQALKLSAGTMKQIAVAQQNAPKKFDEVAKRLKLAGARFDRVEGAPACCVLEDGPGGESTVIKYFSRPVQYEQNKKYSWLHTGEIIQVGMAWRLIDVPNESDGPPQKNLELDRLLDEITVLDRNPPPPAAVVAKDVNVDKYLRQRIGLVQKIIPLDKADQREMWYKQLFDNLTTMAQNSGDDATVGLLKQLKDDVEGKMPGSNLAAYGRYREMWTRYAIGIAKETDPKKIAALQDRWLEQLADFVKTYSKADDTPEALHQLAIGCEFGGKDEEAKRWYTQLSDSFPENGLAPRARGSFARLNLPGKELKLTAPYLADSTKTFDMTQLKGKVAIVLYWASYTNNYADDFVRLKRIMGQISTKGDVELVCVNLDDDAAKAREALKSVQGNWTHLYQAPTNNNSGGGLNSPLAVQYGIHMLPTLFMVGRDGRVTNRALQIGDIESEWKKVQ